MPVCPSFQPIDSSFDQADAVRESAASDRLLPACAVDVVAAAVRNVAFASSRPGYPRARSGAGAIREARSCGASRATSSSQTPARVISKRADPSQQEAQSPAGGYAGKGIDVHLARARRPLPSCCCARPSSLRVFGEVLGRCANASCGPPGCPSRPRRYHPRDRGGASRCRHERVVVAGLGEYSRCAGDLDRARQGLGEARIRLERDHRVDERALEPTRSRAAARSRRASREQQYAQTPLFATSMLFVITSGSPPGSMDLSWNVAVHAGAVQRHVARPRPSRARVVSRARPTHRVRGHLHPIVFG